MLLLFSPPPWNFLSSFLHRSPPSFNHSFSPVGTAEQAPTAMSQLLVRVPCISQEVECLAGFCSGSPPPQCVCAFSTSSISGSLLVASGLSFSGSLDMICRRVKQHKALENRSQTHKDTLKPSLATRKGQGPDKALAALSCTQLLCVYMKISKSGFLSRKGFFPSRKVAVHSFIYLAHLSARKSMTSVQAQSGH